MMLLARTLLVLAAVSQVVAARHNVALRLPPDGLIAGEEVQIEFRVSEGDLAVVRAKIETQIYMPEMPSMPKLIETAHPEGVPGDYGIHPTFPHGGAYRLRLDIFPPAGEKFSADFELNVRDAGTNTSGQKLPPRFRIELASDPKTPKAGEPAKLRLEVRERDSRAAYATFETVHERLMHLVIVSKDLTYFSHEHPEMLPDGKFVLSHAFPQPGEYHLFADAAPKGAGTQVMFAKLKVGGKGKSPVVEPPALSLKARAGTVEAEIVPAENPIPTARTKTVPVVFRDVQDGRPVTDLENYLGAKAHLILVHEDAVTFVHSHPDEREGASHTDGTVPFLLRLPKPGAYRAWLQFIRGGTLSTAAFRIEGAERP
jgi:hypothetical protein